ncbi:hypothetical protein PtB15_11B544 [Puccinia triticina]|nr:hypothetical protein PtB15_11B544 [Puccinia triticina]
MGPILVDILLEATNLHLVTTQIAAQPAPSNPSRLPDPFGKDALPWEICWVF